MTAKRRGAHHAGRAAEEIAERAYLARGGEIVARRWRRAEGEIDLVVALDALTVFVEVKLWRRPGPDSPVTARQWARIAEAAARWFAERGAPPGPCRFDAVLVDREGVPTVIENAHMPGLA